MFNSYGRLLDDFLRFRAVGPPNWKDRLDDDILRGAL